MPAWQMLVSDLASLESWSSKFEAFVDKQFIKNVGWFTTVRHPVHHPPQKNGLFALYEHWQEVDNQLGHAVPEVPACLSQPVSMCRTCLVANQSQNAASALSSNVSVSTSLTRAGTRSSRCTYIITPAKRCLLTYLVCLQSVSCPYRLAAQGWHQEQQVYVIKPANGCSGRRITAAMGTADAAQAAQGLLQVWQGLQCLGCSVPKLSSSSMRACTGSLADRACYLCELAVQAAACGWLVAMLCASALNTADKAQHRQRSSSLYGVPQAQGAVCASCCMAIMRQMLRKCCVADAWQMLQKWGPAGFFLKP
eukprot:296969-Pelagomonas_calceolata.AAC.2